MFASIRRYRLGVGSTVEVVSREVEREFMPLLADLPGFQTYYLVSSSPQELVTVSVFADRSGAEQSVRLAAEWIRSNEVMRQALPAFPEVLAGEVVLSQRARNA